MPNELPPTGLADDQQDHAPEPEKQDELEALKAEVLKLNNTLSEYKSAYYTVREAGSWALQERDAYLEILNLLHEIFMIVAGNKDYGILTGLVSEFVTVKSVLDLSVRIVKYSNTIMSAVNEIDKNRLQSDMMKIYQKQQQINLILNRFGHEAFFDAFIELSKPFMLRLPPDNNGAE